MKRGMLFVTLPFIFFTKAFLQSVSQTPPNEKNDNYLLCKRSSFERISTAFPLKLVSYQGDEANISYIKSVDISKINLSPIVKVRLVFVCSFSRGSPSWLLLATQALRGAVELLKGRPELLYQASSVPQGPDPGA